MRLGFTPIRWGWFATLDLGVFYVNFDFGWRKGWIHNFYIGGRSA